MKNIKSYLFLIILLMTTSIFANSKDISCKSLKYKVLVFGMGMHSGLVIESKELKFLVDDIAQRPYVEIGFGDLGFFRAGDFWSKPFFQRLKIASRALLLPTSPVLHVSGKHYRENNYAYSKEIILNENEYHKLIHFVKTSFALDRDLNPIIIGAGEDGYASRLYKGTGNYHLLNTCNNWVAKALTKTKLYNFSAIKLEELFEKLDKYENQRRCEDI